MFYHAIIITERSSTDETSTNIIDEAAFRQP